MRIQADEQKDKTNNFWCSSCFKGVDLCGILNLSAQHDVWLNPGQRGLHAFLIYKLGPKYFKRTLDSLPYGRAATFREKKKNIYIHVFVCVCIKEKDNLTPKQTAATTASTGRTKELSPKRFSWQAGQS